MCINCMHVVMHVYMCVCVVCVHVHVCVSCVLCAHVSMCVMCMHVCMLCVLYTCVHGGSDSFMRMHCYLLTECVNHQYKKR